MDEKFKEPSLCPCGRRGKFIEIKTEYIDVLKITTKDMYELLKQNEVPEDLDVILLEDNYNMSKLSEGDRIKITGVLKSVPVMLKSGGRSVTNNKLFVCYGLEPIEKSFSDIEFDEQDEKDFNIIKSDPFVYHNKLLFNDLQGIETQKKLTTIGIYSQLNIFAVGSPGRGKTEVFKRASKYAPRNVFIDCPTATASGVLGATTKNQFTGKYSIDGGCLRPVHPNGIALFDEINQDNEKFLQKAILGLISNKRLIVKKANINLDVPCDVTVWATANLVGDSYDNYKKEYQNFGVMAPIWDRFGLKMYYNNELNYRDMGLIKKLFTTTKNKKFTISEKDEILFRKYQLKAKSIEVEFSDSDYEKLQTVMVEYFEKVDSKGSFRVPATIKNLLIGICKLHHRNKPINSDFALMIDLIQNLGMERDLFIKNSIEGV